MILRFKTSQEIALAHFGSGANPWSQESEGSSISRMQEDAGQAEL